MSDLYNRIMELCDMKGISGYKLCHATGIYPSTLTDLKMGRRKSLSADSLNLIASYFGVSIEYLLGKEQEGRLSLGKMTNLYGRTPIRT